MSVGVGIKEFDRTRAYIVAALQWADDQGLDDVGIHLSGALVALDKAQSDAPQQIQRSVV